MPPITLDQAKAHLTAWLEANMAVSTGQEYRIGSRLLRRADLADIQKQIIYWSNLVRKLERGRTGGGAWRAVPRDL